MSEVHRRCGNRCWSQDRARAVGFLFRGFRLRWRELLSDAATFPVHHGHCRVARHRQGGGALCQGADAGAFHFDDRAHYSRRDVARRLGRREISLYASLGRLQRFGAL